MTLIDTIAKAANFETQLSMSYITINQDNRSSAGLLKELTERSIDIAIGTISPTIEEHRLFDFSVQYMQDTTSWVVPSDQMLPHWIGLLLVFDPLVYIGAILILLFLWLASSRIVKLVPFNFRREYICFKNSCTLLFITVGMLLGNEPSKFPYTRFLKSVLLMWTLFCFFWNSAFNAALMSVMTSNVYQDGVREISVILASLF